MTQHLWICELLIDQVVIQKDSWVSVRACYLFGKQRVECVEKNLLISCKESWIKIPHLQSTDLMPKEYFMFPFLTGTLREFLLCYKTVMKQIKMEKQVNRYFTSGDLPLLAPRAKNFNVNGTAMLQQSNAKWRPYF